MKSKNIMTEDLGNGNFRQTETTGTPAIQSRLVCTDATRPDASTMLPGTKIWNTSDDAYNFVNSAGTAWVDAVGTLT
jgi:hypothetical protein